MKKNLKPIISLVIVILLAIIPFLFNFYSLFSVISLSKYILISILCISVLGFIIFFNDKLNENTFFSKNNDLLIFTSNAVMIISFIFFCLISITSINGGSMEDTLYDNDIIITTNLYSDIEIDDIVVIDSSCYLDSDFIIKRVVATSTDLVEYKDDALYVNGIFIQLISFYEYQTLLTYTVDNTSYDFIPEGYYIVLGDNRNNSMDSRSIGLIKEEDIVAKAILRVFPFNKIKLI